MELDNVKEKMQKLIDICEKHLKDEDVQPGFPMWNNETGKQDKKWITFQGQKIEVTWCHYYAYKVFKEMGYEIDILLDPVHKHISWTTVTHMYDKAVSLSAVGWNLSGIKKVSMDNAQVMANNGVPILILSRQGVGHAGILAPNELYNDKNKEGYEPIIYNAGSRQVFGKKSLYDTFLKFGHNPIIFQIQKSYIKE